MRNSSAEVRRVLKRSLCDAHGVAGQNGDPDLIDSQDGGGDDDLGAEEVDVPGAGNDPARPETLLDFLKVSPDLPQRIAAYLEENPPCQDASDAKSVQVSYTKCMASLRKMFRNTSGNGCLSLLLNAARGPDQAGAVANVARCCIQAVAEIVSQHIPPLFVQTANVIMGLWNKAQDGKLDAALANVSPTLAPFAPIWGCRAELECFLKMRAVYVQGLSKEVMEFLARAPAMKPTLRNALGLSDPSRDDNAQVEAALACFEAAVPYLRTAVDFIAKCEGEVAAHDCVVQSAEECAATYCKIAVRAQDLSKTMAARKDDSHWQRQENTFRAAANRLALPDLKEKILGAAPCAWPEVVTEAAEQLPTAPPFDVTLRKTLIDAIVAAEMREAKAEEQKVFEQWQATVKGFWEEDMVNGDGEEGVSVAGAKPAFDVSPIDSLIEDACRANEMAVAGAGLRGNIESTAWKGVRIGLHATDFLVKGSGKVDGVASATSGQAPYRDRGVMRLHVKTSAPDPAKAPLHIYLTQQDVDDIKAGQWEDPVELHFVGKVVATPDTAASAQLRGTWLGAGACSKPALKFMMTPAAGTSDPGLASWVPAWAARGIAPRGVGADADLDGVGRKRIEPIVKMIKTSCSCDAASSGGPSGASLPYDITVSKLVVNPDALPNVLFPPEAEEAAKKKKTEKSGKWFVLA